MLVLEPVGPNGTGPQERRAGIRASLLQEAEMIGYVTLGTNDTKASVEFYDAVFAPLGLKRKFYQENGWAGYGPPDTPEADVEVCICPPYDGNAATAGNGTMIAFRARSQEQVREAYAEGMAHGGTDEGRPGFRPEGSDQFYGAYLRDPFGNKICVFRVEGIDT